MGALFELCWRVSPEPDRISAAILYEKPEMIRQYIGFLLVKNQLPAVPNVASHLVNFGDPETDLPLMFSVVNRLLAASYGDSANALCGINRRGNTGWRRITRCPITPDLQESRSPSVSTGPLLPIRGSVLWSWAFGS